MKLTELELFLLDCADSFLQRLLRTVKQRCKGPKEVAFMKLIEDAVNNITAIRCHR